MTQEIIVMAKQAGFWKDLFAYPEFKEHLETFAKLVAKHTLLNIAPSKFISWQEGFEVGAAKERDAIIDLVAMYGGPVDLEAAIRARGEA